MSVSKVKEANPVLPVRDVEATVKFYIDGLGFRISFRDCTAPDKYVGVRRDGVEMHLQYQRIEDMPKPGTLVIRFIVEDPDTFLAEFRERGVADESKTVEEMPWGTREFTIRDPNGHHLIFYHDI